MADEAPTVKTIVVPKALEQFFAEKLRTRYGERNDIDVIVDRRDGERRGPDGWQAADAERRQTERRLLAGWWSLPDLPFETEQAS